MSDQEVKIIIKATDDTSAAAQSASQNIDVLTKKTTDLNAAQQKASINSKEVVVGLSGVATSAYALYMGYDNLLDSQVNVNKSITAAKAAANSAEDAQVRYTAVVVKFGAASPEAKAALDDLNIAKERAINADERAAVVQGNLSESYVAFGLSVLPATVTMVSNMDKVMVGLGASTSLTSGIATIGRGAWALMTGQMSLSAAATGIMTAAQGALNLVMSINPIFLVVAALAALAAGLVWAYYNCEPFREAVNAIGTALYTFFKPAIDAVTWAIGNLGAVWNAVLEGMRWVWDNTIGPIIDALGWVWSTLSGAWAGLSAGTPSAAQAEPEPVVGFAHGFEGVISKPTTMLVGEAGAEYVSVTPGSPGGYGNGYGGRAMTVNGPLVVIEGSADEKTALLAADIIMKQIRKR